MNDKRIDTFNNVFGTVAEYIEECSENGSDVITFNEWKSVYFDRWFTNFREMDKEDI